MGKPILLIIGAGKNVGAATVQKFLDDGYKVAQASRSVKPEDSTEDRLFVQCNIFDPSTIEQAFRSVTKLWGGPDVVIYNAATMHPVDKDDVLSSVAAEDFAIDLTGNVTSAFVAAKEAVEGFKTLPDPSPRTFMFTGNLANDQVGWPGFLTLGVGKSAVAYMIAEADACYKPQGYHFYYVDERNSEGGPGGFVPNAQAHADFFLELANGSPIVPWQATFVAGEGYRKFAKEDAKARFQ